MTTVHSFWQSFVYVVAGAVFVLAFMACLQGKGDPCIVVSMTCVDSRSIKTIEEYSVISVCNRLGYCLCDPAEEPF